MTNDLLDFYQPPGPYPLGSVGTSSMPEEEDLGFGDPLAKAYGRMNQFTKQTAIRFGSSDKPSGVVYDPRGSKALSGEFSDFRKIRRVPKNFGYLTQQNFNAEIRKMGVLKLNNAIAQTALINPMVLHNPKSGLSAWGAQSLGASLSQYTRSTVDTINVPTGTPLKISNDLGFVTGDGGLPAPLLNKGPQATTQAIANLMSGRAPYQYVDANGVVNKYGPGTGPYDAPGTNRPGGISGVVPGTRIVRGLGVIVQPKNIVLTSEINVLGQQQQTQQTCAPVKGLGVIIQPKTPITLKSGVKVQQLTTTGYASSTTTGTSGKGASADVDTLVTAPTGTKVPQIDTSVSYTDTLPHSYASMDQPDVDPPKVVFGSVEHNYNQTSTSTTTSTSAADAALSNAGGSYSQIPGDQGPQDAYTASGFTGESVPQVATTQKPGLPWAYVFGFAGLSIAAILGLGMLAKGIK